MFKPTSILPIILLSICSFIGTMQISFAQWQKTGIDSMDINCITSLGNNIFAGTNNGIYFSSNNGSNWVKSNNGLSDTIITAMLTQGTAVLAGTINKIYQSTDNGYSWAHADNGIIDTIATGIATNGSTIYASFKSCYVYKSTDNGTNWTSVTNGIPETALNCIAANGSNVYVGTYGGIFISTNYGASWTFNNVIDSTVLLTFAFNGSDIFGGTFDGIYLSTDNGTAWTQVSNLKSIYSVVVNQPVIYAGTEDGVYLSPNNGADWVAANDGLNSQILSLSINGSYLYAGTYGKGIWKRPLTEINSVAEKNNASNILIFPNPASDEIILNLNSGSPANTNIRIFDLMGNEIRNISIYYGTNNTIIDISQLSPAVYIVQVKNMKMKFIKM
jgi:ligand-binding sensor domain-containing protein